jgi:hypothetical protein
MINVSIRSLSDSAVKRSRAMSNCSSAPPLRATYLRKRFVKLLQSAAHLDLEVQIPHVRLRVGQPPLAGIWLGLGDFWDQQGPTQNSPLTAARKARAELKPAEKVQRYTASKRTCTSSPGGPVVPFRDRAFKACWALS